MASELAVSWEDYHLEIERLCLLIRQSGWSFDHLICLARGGLRVGDVVSRMFRQPLAVLSASSYRESAGRQQGALEIAESITYSAGPIRGRVLLVDDLVDSGTTLESVSQRLRQMPGVAEVKTAVIWWKPRSSFAPDYYVRHLMEDVWIRQPFEVYDALGWEALSENHRVSGEAESP